MAKLQLCWALALHGLISLTEPARSAELVTLASGEWPPYTSKALSNQGFYSEIVRQAFALEGYQVKYIYLPWSRAYMYTKQGDVDGSLTWAKTTKKEQEVIFSDAVFWHTKVFFHRQSMPFTWDSLGDLQGIKIGTTDQYTYGESFDLAAMEKKLDTENAPSDLSNLKKLLNKRIDLFPSDILAGQKLISLHFSQHQASQITYHTKPIQYISTHVVFSKKKSARSRLLVDAFNRGLKKLKLNGAHNRIYQDANVNP